MTTRGLYAFNAFNGQVPDGAVGATLFAPWSELNPAQGAYTWGSLDSQIALHALNGHSVSLMVTVSRSGWYGEYLYIDDTPSWVRQGTGVTRSVAIAGKTMRLPAYDDAGWRAAMQTFVAVLGKRYDGDARIANVTVGLGLDGETHAYKSDYETYVTAALGTAYKSAFEMYCKEAISWYDAAFPLTALYVAANPGGQSFRRDIIRNYLIPLNIGYKNCGLQIDDPTAWGPATYEGQGGNYALWAPMRDLQSLLPVWLESTTATNATAESVYWSLLLGMSWRPAGIDLHAEWFTINPEAIAWANGYLAEPERGAWIVLRDREYGAYSPSIPDSSSMYLSGWPGDYEWGMTRASDAPRMLRATLPLECRDQIESRQVRSFNEGMTLQVLEPAELGERLVLRVCFLERRATFSIAAGEVQKTLGGGASKRMVWQEWQIDVPSDWDGVIAFAGAASVHMVEIRRIGDVGAPAPPPMSLAPPATDELVQVLRQLSDVLRLLIEVLGRMTI